MPIQSIGIYVPANLPSTLLMNAIPAKIAGVKRIVIANPKNNGKLNPAVLYAAKKLGINEIYSMGGAQAIGSLAYIQKVNKIVGPGNIFVAGAKRQVFGDVGIEGMIAGPSEITILADSKTNLNEVTTSMIGQAEHDSNSQCILITKDLNLIKKFKKDLALGSRIWDPPLVPRAVSASPGPKPVPPDFGPVVIAMIVAIIVIAAVVVIVAFIMSLIAD